MSDLDDAITRASGHAPFLRGLIRREPDLLALMAGAGFDAALEASLARLDPADPAPSIRMSRAGIALTVAMADLSGAWALEQVTEALTRFADRALDFAISTAFAERGAEPAGLVALALGKMGSRELNYSSDIDPIFIHDPETLPRRPNEDPTEAAVRIVRRVVALLAERTADGYALRVDLRLRPDPDSTSASLPVGAAETYYQSQALAWERSAFIRARAAAGDIALGSSFLASIEPFIWRRSLDYSALAEIREVSHRIRDHFAEGQALGPGFDLKRGRGGIREVEFFAQVHQMIFGGRDPSLRAGATMDALAALAQAGRIAEAEADILASAYRHYRTIEHRIQMIDDQQSHSIPKQAAGRAAIAGLMGHAHWREVEAALQPPLRAVSTLYDRLLESSGETRRGPRIPPDREEAERWATKARLKDPALFGSLVTSWRSGRHRSLRAPEARAAFEAILPPLVQQVATGKAGREGLLRLDQMITAMPSGVQFWRLLAAHPPLTGVVGRLLTTTPLLADALARRPDLIDTLLEPALPLPDIAAARAELDSITSRLTGELLLDRVRLWNAERRFHLGVQLLDGDVAPLDAARRLALMAEASVARLAEGVEAEFAERHGKVPGAGLAVLALGRLGGGELTAQSDLDLVFLYPGSHETSSDGAQPLAAGTYFNRLGQRLIAALTVPTAAGALYDVDTRLRPSGAQGQLVVSTGAFLRYQQQDAELWETMALTRARPIFGPPGPCADVAAGIHALIAAPRDPAEVHHAVLAMRKLMARHKPPAGPFDVKLMKGGLVDIEFILQARALASSTPVPPGLAEAAARLAPELVAPAQLMMAILVMLRLIQPYKASAAPDAAAAALLARACGKTDFAALKADLALARTVVHAAWDKTFERT